jgi:hypothetical protein
MQGHTNIKHSSRSHRSLYGEQVTRCNVPTSNTDTDERFFFSSVRPHQLRCPLNHEVLFPGQNGSGSEAQHSSLTSDEFKTKGLLPPLPTRLHDVYWSFNFLQFLGAIKKLWKATICFVVSVNLPSVRPYGWNKSGAHWTDCNGILYLLIFRKSAEKIQFSLKPDKNIG